MTALPDISAVIVAGGSSSRMRGTDKLLSEIGGVPVIIRTISTFAGVPEVAELIVVTSAERAEVIKQLCVRHGITRDIICVEGGDTRRRSAENGYRASHCPLVAVHDGARPLVTAELIRRTAAAAAEYGAAIAAVPVKDTVKLVSGGVVTETPDRSGLFAAQTPQIFTREVYEKALGCGENATDDASMAEMSGARVHIVEGDYRNIKITTPEDLTIAAALAL